MVIDDNLLSSIMQNNADCNYTLHIDNKSYRLRDISITKSQTPLTRPNMRGGVYFSDTFHYKIKATVADTAIIPFLSKAMLGPNTEFKNLKITSSLKKDDNVKKILVYTNLTNTMQSSSKVELNMVIVDIKED
ncbi:MAG TPA: hypothetical protein VD689_04950 [Nitrosopumilaceae archaeon]|nr:hypothetical protein [Nitrosopumilaceae archaeon]